MPMSDGAFKLYVAGGSDDARRAEETVRRVLSGEHLRNYHLEVIDVSASPGRAKDDGVSAFPTLLPPRAMSGRRIVGDLSREEQIRALINSWSK